MASSKRATAIPAATAAAAASGFASLPDEIKCFKDYP
jgi:hypothetical protein